MKIFYYAPGSGRLISLGGKTALKKITNILNLGSSILLRDSDERMQSDFRIRKVPEEMKTDRGYKMIKAFYMINLEMGKTGFETFSPKQVIFEQNLRFSGLDRAINMLEVKQSLKRADWLIEKNSKKI